MKLSVVIPTCDRPEDLQNCLRRLQANTQLHPPDDYDIIVSDDGRHTLAAAVLSEEFPGVRWMEGPRRGPAANRNAGAAAARGEIIIFLDDDCLPQPELLSAYATYFADPQAQAAEGCIRADRPQQHMDEEAPVNESGGCFWSCNIAMRRAFFQEIGGFDERFPAASMEDVELRERIRRRGVPIMFLPDALVIHPQRRMGGWSYLRKHAEAHGTYILLPCCHLGAPSYRAATWNTFRIIRRKFMPRFFRLHGRGALRASRMLLLPLWSTWCMKKALREAKAMERQPR